MKKYFSKIIILLIVIILGSSTVALAESGRLQINNQAIYRQDKEKQLSTGNQFYLPDLFLEKKTLENKKISQEKENKLEKIQTQVFLYSTPEKPTVTSQVSPILFKKENVTEELVAHKDNSVSSKGIKYGLIFLVCIGGALVLLFGVLLGKKFSHVIK